MIYMEYPLSNTLFILLISFRFEIRFSIKTGLRSHSFQIKCVLYVLPNSNYSDGGLKSDLNKIQFETSSMNAKQDLLPN